MLLIMFDIDGTLTESYALDAAAFLDAVHETFGFRDVCDDWSGYRHVTGTGVLREIVETRLGRPPSQEETGRMQARLRMALSVGIEAAGGIKPIPGAPQILSRLQDSPGEYGVALASGNWAAIARLMFDSAGFQVDGIPAAYSDDAVAREDICRTAHLRAEARYGQEFPRVVYIGDGVWDLRAAQALGYGFVGIGRGANAAKLRAAGAMEVRPDFEDMEAFLAAVGHAATTPPASPRSAETTESAH